MYSVRYSCTIFPARPGGARNIDGPIWLGPAVPPPAFGVAPGGAALSALGTARTVCAREPCEKATTNPPTTMPKAMTTRSRMSHPPGFEAGVGAERGGRDRRFSTSGHGVLAHRIDRSLHRIPLILPRYSWADSLRLLV